jgi:heat shock protein HslJ
MSYNIGTMKKVKLFAVLLILLFITSLSGCTNLNNPLNGTKWKLVGWSISSIDISITTITLNFEDNKNLRGNGGVNSYGASYKLGLNNSITIGTISATNMASTNPEINRAESTYFILLNEVKYYELANEKLILLDKGKNQLLIFEKQ